MGESDHSLPSSSTTAFDFGLRFAGAFSAFSFTGFSTLAGLAFLFAGFARRQVCRADEQRRTFGFSSSSSSGSVLALVRLPAACMSCQSQRGTMQHDAAHYWRMTDRYWFGWFGWLLLLVFILIFVHFGLGFLRGCL